MKKSDFLSQLVSLAKRRGFIFPACDIYGGLSSIWDYGPLGANLKKNIKDLWWKSYVESRDDIVGLDAAIIMSPPVFMASGHLEGFNDVLVDCPACQRRFKLEELKKKGEVSLCPECGSEINLEKNMPRSFNLMLKTFLGVVENKQQEAYLRPETAQGIFVNFLNVLNTTHKSLPFGIAQIGKSFRNEVTTKTFIFRMREFEQMEIEYFVRPQHSDKYYHYWVEERFRWYQEKLGIRKENLRLRQHTKEELAHYAKACTDIEYRYPFSTTSEGWKELEGIANRTDYDLRRHSEYSHKDLSCFLPQEDKRIIPYVIEPSGGVDRTVLAVLSDAYAEEEVRGKKRVVLRLHKNVAPYKIAVFPLLKNNPDLVAKAKKIFELLKNKYVCVYDDTASIGRLYRRQDEIGTPFCITVDVESLSDDKVTVRDRDTMKQERIGCSQLIEYFAGKFQV